MRRFTEYLSGAAVVLFQVALTGWMYALSEINFDFISMELDFVLLSAWMLAAYFLNIFMVRRGVPAPVFAIAQIAVVTAGVFAFIHAAEMEPYVGRTLVINCIIYCLGFAVAAMVAWFPTDQNGILRRFDILAIMIVLMLVLDHVLGIPGAQGALSMCYFCLVVIVLASISLKSGALTGRGSAVQGNPALGKIMLFIVFGLIGLFALLVLIYASSGVKIFSEFLIGIVTACAEAVKAALRFLSELLDRFAKWLSQFVDDTPVEPWVMEGVGDMQLPQVEESAMELPVWFYYVLGAIAAAVLAFIIFRLRKFRTSKISPRAVVITTVHRESGLMKALKELWKTICGWVRFRYNCLRYRRSPAGLLVWCEKKAPEELQRRSDESGERYLLRLGTSLGGEAEKTMEELACLVERSFYSPVNVPVSAGLYKSVRRIKFKTAGKEQSQSSELLD